MRGCRLILVLPSKSFMYDEARISEGSCPLISLGNTSAIIPGHHLVKRIDMDPQRIHIVLRVRPASAPPSSDNAFHHGQDSGRRGNARAFHGAAVGLPVFGSEQSFKHITAPAARNLNAWAVFMNGDPRVSSSMYRVQ